MRLKLLIFLGLAVALPNLTSAQGIDNQMIGQIAVNLQPSHPDPTEEFSVSLGMIDGGSEIFWFIDGEEVENNRNQRKVTYFAPASGETMTIRADVVNLAGIRSSVTREINPVYLDLILEPQTYVPDFYQGRSLPSVGSQMNATALIDDQSLSTEDLIYRWEIDGVVLRGGPVRGQNRVSFEMPLFARPSLSLRVTDLQGNVVASKFTTINTVRPVIHFYEKSALYGLKKRPFTDRVNLLSQTSLIEAVPYHLDSRVYNNPDIKEWGLGSETYNNLGGNPYEITLEASGESGVVNLGFQVRSLAELLQGAEASVDIRI